MTKPNPENERIKRQYLSYLKEAGRLSEASVDQVAAAIDRFAAYNKQRSFKAFHIEQAIAFKKHLATQTSRQTGEPLSKATLYSTLTALKRFFIWLADRPGYKSRIRYTDAEYFNLSEKETRIAKTHREPRMPTLEQIRHVLQAMPASTPIERRDRALLATTILTGARDGALASLKLRHIDVEQNYLDQDARDVRTKFSKTIPTTFYPLGDDILQIVVAWVEELRCEEKWGEDDPLFPATLVEVGETDRLFTATGLARRHWSNAGPIRRIFRKAFTDAGLPYFNPHSFRRTLALLGERRCRTIEEFKAWSENLGHEDALTTLRSYGQLPNSRRRELIQAMSVKDDDEDDPASILRRIARMADRSPLR